MAVYALRRSGSDAATRAFAPLADDPRITLRTGPYPGLRGPVRILRTLSDFRRFVREFRPDVVHTHTEFPDLFGALVPGSFAGALVRTVHNERFMESAGWGRIADKLLTSFRYHRTVAVSSRIARQFRSASKVATIYNGVFDDANPPPARSCVRRRAARPRAAIVGRLTRQKGQLAFLEFVAARYGDRDLPFTLALFGDGPDRAKIDRYLARFGGEIEARGFVADKEEIYRDLDVVLVPSRHEGLSTVMLEALARGIPVVSLPVSGADDVIVPGVNGAIARDLGEMAGYLERRALPAPDAAAAAALRARFSRARCAERHETEYLNALRSV